MADIKISDMPAASSVADADITPIVQSGTNKKSAFSVIKAYIQAAFDSIYVPLTRTLTIGGTAQTLAANRAWTTNTILEGLGTPAQGDIIFRGSANWTELGAGTDGHVLTTHGAASNPTWAANAAASAAAHYLTSTSESSLSNEVNLGALTTGLLKGSVSAGVSTVSSITDNSTNWDTAYSERHQWDGGSTNLVAATGRTSLGGTTVGQNAFTLTNPSAITFVRINADNSVSALDAATFRTAIGAGTGGGDFSGPGSSTDNAIVRFDGTTGKLGQNSGVTIDDSGHMTVEGVTSTGATGTGKFVFDTAPQISTIELGNASDTTIARSSGGHISVEGSVVGLASNDLSFFTASTSNAIGVGSIELGHATDTTLSRSGAGVLQVEGVVVPTVSSTNTLSNKRTTPRITTITSSGTPTINTDNCDAVTITALAAAISTMTTNLSGTPTNFDKLIFRIKDDGTARAISWGASFVAEGVALPTTTVLSKVLTVGFIYDSVKVAWGCVASAQEA